MKSINEPCVIIDFASHPKVLMKRLRESERLLNEVLCDPEVDIQVDEAVAKFNIEEDIRINNMIRDWFTRPKE